MNNGFVHRAAAIAITCVVLITSAVAVRQLVTIEESQPARHVEGVVVDPSGAPISDMVVTDRSDQWAAVLRTTTTDSKGRFRFSHQSGKTVYYLQFDHPLFNPLRLRLKLDKNAPDRLVVKAPIGG